MSTTNDTDTAAEAVQHLVDALTMHGKPLTEAQAAEWLQISSRSLTEERRRGRVAYYRIVGAAIRYTIEQLNDYLRNHPLNDYVADPSLDEQE